MKVFYCDTGSRSTTINLAPAELQALHERLMALPPETFAFQTFQKKIAQAVEYWNAQPVNPAPIERPRERFDWDDDIPDEDDVGPDDE